LDYDSKVFFLGSMKSESYKEQTPMYSVAIVDGSDIKFIVLPHYKCHPIIEVTDENQLREELSRLFKYIHKHNSTYYLYDIDGNIIDSKPIDKYTTSFINIKFKVYDKNIKKKNIDLIIDYCKHEIDDPIFMAINVKSVYHIESGNSVLAGDDDRFIKIDKKDVSSQKMILFEFIDSIKSGTRLPILGSNKKFVKIVEMINDSEIERFSEFIVSTKKEKDFLELLRAIN